MLERDKIVVFVRCFLCIDYLIVNFYYLNFNKRLNKYLKNFENLIINFCRLVYCFF